MFNPTELTISAFVEHLQRAYLANFDTMRPDHPGIIAWVGRMALERIADSDALYHDMNHTMLVTLVGQEILRGKHIREGGVSPDDWLHTVVALLCHDIGYSRGVCRADRDGEYIINEKGDTVKPPPGASDAFLTPYHVDRGKIFVRERFGLSAALDAERVVQALELTRFPVPAAEDRRNVPGEPDLVRAADLIGQLADPAYMRKIKALYHEFEETGTNVKLNYKNAADLAENYPGFYWHMVRPYISDGLRFLQVTQAGKQWIANLYAHVFAAEHKEYQLGPQRSSPQEAAAE